MSESGEVARKCPAYVSSADESDSHVHSSFSDLITSASVRPVAADMRVVGFTSLDVHS